MCEDGLFGAYETTKLYSLTHAHTITIVLINFRIFLVSLGIISFTVLVQIFFSCMQAGWWLYSLQATRI
jgi:hypothetical protein